MEQLELLPAMEIVSPSSGASRHLLPRGEKRSGETPAPSSPRRGEGGSRSEPGEGAIAFTVAAERAADIPARDALLDRAMGPRWRRKSSEKLRRGRLPAEGLALVARDDAGAVIGIVRLWDVTFDQAISPLEGEMPGRAEGGSSRPASPPPSVAFGDISPSRGEIGRALLLGPLAVDPGLKSSGIGSALMRRAIAEAARLGHGAILLMGDAPYYARFGFSAEMTASLAMPGPYERHRFLALELKEGALDGATGVLRASGRKVRAPKVARAA